MSEPPDTLWIVFESRGSIAGFYRTPEEAGKAAGWGASIVAYTQQPHRESYLRGWRDAVAAAAVRLRELRTDYACEAVADDADINLQSLGAMDGIDSADRAIAALTPPG